MQLVLSLELLLQLLRAFGVVAVAHTSGGNAAVAAEWRAGQTWCMRL